MWLQRLPAPSVANAAKFAPAKTLRQREVNFFSHPPQKLSPRALRNAKCAPLIIAAAVERVGEWVRLPGCHADSIRGRARVAINAAAALNLGRGNAERANYRQAEMEINCCRSSSCSDINSRACHKSGWWRWGVTFRFVLPRAASKQFLKLNEETLNHINLEFFNGLLL